ncbi:copper resistance CopC family protein [Dactylosporangium sp. CS-033363]|uniref:copper resistance CopC family protein n=1 Tax=Dactylosporangium sp. CS-033363 TaxID=3239935 RepID=UPI003D91539E
MRLRSTIGGVLAAAVLVLFVPGPAWAHSTLLRTDPADGATVSTPLTAVALTFNEPVKQQFSTIVVTGADGKSYVDGKPHAVDRTLSQAVRPLPAGAVTVAWRTVSADGHPIEGRFAFTNSAAAAPSTDAQAPPTPGPTTQAPTTQAAAPTPAAAAGDGSSGLPWAVAGGVVVVVLAGGAVLWRRRSGAGRSG